MSIQRVILAAMALAAATPAAAQKDTVILQKGAMTVTRSGIAQAQAITIHRGDAKCPKGTHWVVIVMDDGSGSFGCVRS